MSFLEREIERIEQSGVLGRSPVYARLLAYLRETTEQGKSPKEADIAVEVFKRLDFDPAADSSVRVYLHNLRQKLESYYKSVDGGEGPSRFIYIPKGEYKLQIGERAGRSVADPVPTPSRASRVRAAAALVAVLAIALSVSAWLGSREEPGGPGATAVWEPILTSDRTLVLVIGDYYMFAEIGEDGATRRLIRDFRINGREDLETGYRDPAVPERRFADIRLHYLPLGIAPALAEILEVIHAAGKSPVVIPESQLDIQTLRSSDILYLGYVSGLGVLSEFVFASSNLAPGSTYDELIDKRNGEIYVSEAGFLDGPATDYVDFGLLSTFAGPTGNQLLVLAGMRDEGLMQMASILSSEDAIRELMADTPGIRDADPLSMEALYRVRGMHRLNIASNLVFAAPLEAERIWLGNPGPRLSSSPAAVPTTRQ